MKTLETTLLKERNQLKEIVIEAKQRLETAPQGHLQIMRKRNGAEYYLRGEKNNRNGRYIRKDEKNLIKGIVQKDYDEHIVKKAEERIKAIDTFLKKYEKTDLKNIYQEMNPCRKELVDAPIISDEEFIAQWQSMEYKGKLFLDDENEIITEKGERVRSKSEKIIADKLYMLGIPYRYEYPITLKGNIKVYPDFTILRMPMREEVYLEHFGMMSDANYVENAMNKLSMYERSGIYLGVNLFITYETSKKPLNIRALDGMIKRLFCLN